MIRQYLLAQFRQSPCLDFHHHISRCVLSPKIVFGNVHFIASRTLTKHNTTKSSKEYDICCVSSRISPNMVWRIYCAGVALFISVYALSSCHCSGHLLDSNSEPLSLTASVQPPTLLHFTIMDNYIFLKTCVCKIFFIFLNYWYCHGGCLQICVMFITQIRIHCTLNHGTG